MRLFFGAKPFASNELDELATRMNSVQKMSKNPKDRWFIGRGTTGYSTRTRVVLGSKLNDKLTEGQRLAVAAHELVHVREGDVRHYDWHVTYSSYLAGIIIFVLSYVVWRFPPVAAILGFIGWFVSLVILDITSAGWRRKVELRCDAVAVSFVDGNDLISALTIQESLIPPRFRKSLAYKMGSRKYPSLSEREKVVQSAMNSLPATARGG